jgi:hypothetical protein
MIFQPGLRVLVRVYLTHPTAFSTPSFREIISLTRPKGHHSEWRGQIFMILFLADAVMMPLRNADPVFA